MTNCVHSSPLQPKTLSRFCLQRAILEHAKLLQAELRLSKRLELWYAPGNTEVPVAQYQQDLTACRTGKIIEEVHEAEALKSGAAGFEPEQYAEEEKG